MVQEWINFFIYSVSEYVSFLDSCILFGSVSILKVIVVSLVAAIITATFVSVAHK